MAMILCCLFEWKCKYGSQYNAHDKEWCT